MLGRIGATLLGGELQLDAQIAGRAIEEKIGRPLGLPLLDAAHGIVELLNNNMAAAIRAVSIERGYDPRRFALVAGGGGGALHAGRLAELLGMPLAVVPATAGLLSTVGLLASDLKTDYVQTRLQRNAGHALGGLDAMLAEVEARARDWFRNEAIAEADASISHSAGLRYVNQAFEITVPVTPGARGAIDEAAVANMTRTFHEEHERLYGWASETLPVELVNVGVTALGRLAKLSLREGPAREKPAKPAATRQVYFGPEHGLLETPIFEFDALGPGWSATGPAIVEQRFSRCWSCPATAPEWTATAPSSWRCPDERARHAGGPHRRRGGARRAEGLRRRDGRRDRAHFDVALHPGERRPFRRRGRRPCAHPLHLHDRAGPGMVEAIFERFPPIRCRQATSTG